MRVVKQVEAPSKRRLDVVDGARLEPWRLTKYNAFNIGYTWLPLRFPVDPALRRLDRRALSVLEHDGALDAHGLAERLVATKRFRHKRLKTDITTEIAAAWLGFADRRFWVEPYGEDPPEDPHARWRTSPRGSEQLKRKAPVGAMLTVVGVVSSLLGIAATVAGGAAVINEVVEENLALIASVGILLGTAVVYALVGFALFRIMSAYTVRTQVAALDILSRNDLLGLRGPRAPMRGDLEDDS